MRYLIDGYNLLFKLGLQGGDPARARLRLCEFIADLTAGRPFEATIVFDAHRLPTGVPREQNYRGMRLIYSVGRPSADDLIEEMLSNEADPRSLGVVSDDHRIRLAAREEKARDLTVAAFLDEMEADLPSREGRGDSPEEVDKPSEVSDAERRRWLDVFSDLEGDPELRDAFGEGYF